MHIPVLLCGLICGWKFGMLCGLIGPVLSNLVTGMPAVMALPAMTAELTVYGLVTGLMIMLVRTKHTYIDIYAALLVAMVAGRIAAGIMRALTISLFVAGDATDFTVAMWVTSYFVRSLPGIITHLIIIPAIMLALYRARLIPKRYLKSNKYN